jgi:predicted regulator of Ras-like GTPase activity (Roadblock/LC7/MglB family)
MMQKALESINRTKGVLGSAVVGNDGILISALSATLADTGNKISQACGAGDVGQILLEGETGKVLILAVSLGWLIVLTSAQVNIGLVRVEMRQAAKTIG